MKKILMFFMALLTLVAATPTANAKRSIMELPLFERAVLIIKKFETLHKPKHSPPSPFPSARSALHPFHIRRSIP